MTLEGGGQLVTRDDIIRLYHELLGRDPENEGAITGRLGRLLSDVYDEIYNSAEAQALREATGPQTGTVGGHGGGGGGGGGGGSSGGGGGGGGGGSFGGGGDDLASKISQLLAAINHSGATTVADLQTKIHEITSSIETIQSTLLGEIQKQISAQAPALAKVLASLQKQIETQINGVVPNIGQLIFDALGGATSLVSAFLSSAADVTDVAQAFVDAFTSHHGDLIGFGLELAGGVGRRIVDDAIKRAAAGEFDGGDAIAFASSIVTAATAAHSFESNRSSREG